jgi:hypothetical protein
MVQAMSNEEVRARLVVVVCGMIASDKFPSSERVRRLRSLLKNLDPSFEATELPLWLKRTSLEPIQKKPILGHVGLTPQTLVTALGRETVAFVVAAKRHSITMFARLGIWCRSLSSFNSPADIRSDP